MVQLNAESGRGTAWRIWDLHVHTPASLVQHYGADNDETWERFISELEKLPEEMSVIEINDYWFLDGYERVLKERKKGRLQNLEAIFPVIEMRLDQFGGTDSKLSRVNLHVIFDPNLEVEVISAQFISALQPKISLAPGYAEVDWQGVITKKSLCNLGRKIKDTVPLTERERYGSDLMEGFNNINVRLDDVKEVLDGPYFRGKALIGIGKTEWSDIKWNEQSIASKKNVINSSRLLFTAYPDASRWSDDVEKLRASNVTYKILDCSDAHYFLDSDQPMRLGMCQTWMNTTPSFAGLTYALEEFERRVYVGLEPPAVERIRKNRERFIKHVRVRSEKKDCNLFDHDLPLNPGFVAVVGNKGQGKSALLDCIALGGNSSRNKEFAFLSASRFLNKRNEKVARDYTTELVWATNTTPRKVRLTDGHDGSVPVSVEYLPQMFVERVCSIDPGTDGIDEFERELRTILFTHIDKSERAGEKTFEALLAHKTQSSDDDVLRLRKELSEAVRQYVAATTFRFENKAEEVQNRFKLKQEEVTEAEKKVGEAEEALAEIDSGSKDDDELADRRKRSEEIEKERSRLLEQRRVNEHKRAQMRRQLADMESLIHRAEAIREDVDEINRDVKAILGDEGETLVSLTINEARYISWRSSTKETVQNLEVRHQELGDTIAEREKDLLGITGELAAADSARERARQRVLQSKEHVTALMGDEDEPESYKGLKALLCRINDAPARVDQAREQILRCSERIYEALNARLRAVESMYSPAADFIARSEVVKNAGLQFSAELRMLPSWKDVSAGLDGRRNGDFIEWLRGLPQRIEDTSWEQLKKQLAEALCRLEHERGELSGELRNPGAALRSSTTLEEFLNRMFDLAWLEVSFGLTGDGRPLSQLSPGQRGLVLALFYLVVDQRTTPLLLDQPEENLDNETIASKLVPAIHEAAGRRQTIVVTHNANLAVVGDADQIIHCQIRDGRFTVSSGSIAELDVARSAVNILEGTKPAFDNRRHKYEAFPSLT
ncbi:TrlF family AAA-like ATPase [Actinobaculum sp. 313]|uniref:TrlF family AAA-like ATPase n=1 Tax=Actinobaculum sp. 313 TaxID=2495645 RepID=UPI000D52A69F|nr:chromosome segregation protein SMC [Actinobaculum sp. 313]AWE41878.1 chromosome segregation protein SMC [Actinobaculum sp. 313]